VCSTSPSPAAAVTPPFTVDRRPLPISVLELSFLAPCMAGVEPFTRTARRDRRVVPEDLLPAHVTVERGSVDETNRSVVARGVDCSLHIEAGRDRVQVTVTAATTALAERVIDDVLSRLPEEDQPDTVNAQFWHLGGGGPQGQARQLAAPRWPDIACNYPTGVRSDLGALMAVTAPEQRGGLVLWHGEPGTGKTTALRALLRAWSPWCEAHVVTDPERAFAHGDYLTELLLASGRLPWDPGPSRSWKLLVAEDADDYLRAGAKERAGAALGRLLNVGDGLIGQGLRVLVLLTTNHELATLHPALVRPGRCLAQVEFRRFDANEATAWLRGAARAPGDGATLAELYELRGDVTRIGRERTPNRSGLYL